MQSKDRILKNEVSFDKSELMSQRHLSEHLINVQPTQSMYTKAQIVELFPISLLNQ